MLAYFKVSREEKVEFMKDYGVALGLSVLLFVDCALKIVFCIKTGRKKLRHGKVKWSSCKKHHVLSLTQLQ